jgi:hypothetical protein
MSIIERTADPGPAPRNLPIVQNSGIPITDYTRGSEAWNDLFGPYSAAALPAPTRYTRDDGRRRSMPAPA